MNIRVILVSIIFLIALNMAGCFDSFKPEKKYVGISYTQAIEDTKPIILVFIVNWCTYCQRLLPKLEIINKSYSDKYNIVVIDCENRKYYKMKQQFSIKGYPTMYIVDPVKKTKTQFNVGHTNDMSYFSKALDNYLLYTRK